MLLEDVLQFLIEVEKFLERRLVCVVTEEFVEVWDKLQSEQNQSKVMMD